MPRRSKPQADSQDTKGPVRLKLVVAGQVQGVGFRPFVYRLAHEIGLTGTVGNTSEGVRIEVQGEKAAAMLFEKRLKDELPPLAHITGLKSGTIAPIPAEAGFVILESEGHQGHHVLVSPDVGICADCLADMHDAENARHRYPFTNCTNCGPRYTITRSIPYDRAVTSMACFPMCPACEAEYKNPLDRRFHAQPIACPVCGPRLWYVEAHEQNTAWQNAQGPACARDERGKLALDALEKTAEALLDGKIVAIRGLGGFQLACDAGSRETVARLRALKHRPHKSFALMARDLDAVRSICQSDAKAESLLASAARPAVILPKLPGGGMKVAESVAPDLFTLAVMLPTTPLHEALFMTLEELCRDKTCDVPILVMTSGNDSGDPICLGNREALRRLASCADAFLFHDRDILCRVDDTVALAETVDAGHQKETRTVFFRRARGYVPEPVELPVQTPSLQDVPCVLAMGADLKSTCCLTRKNLAFVGQHTGDLENVAAAAFHKEIVDHLSKLLEVSPALVVTDLHPNFSSTAMGRQKAEELGVPVVSLQHHAAHAASVLAEHKVTTRTLAVVLDGFGLGDDETLWGGEFLFMDLSRARWSRSASFAPIRLPGGDAATRAPWRIALALARDTGNGELLSRLAKERGKEAQAVLQMLEKDINCPATTSCGRLFDAVSAALGVCEDITYEGQAAIRLETLALHALEGMIRHDLRECISEPNVVAEIVLRVLCKTTGLDERGEIDFIDFENGCIDSQALFNRALDLHRTNGPAVAALDFHASLSLAVDRMASFILENDEETNMPWSREKGLAVALGGGVFNNGLVRALVETLLGRHNFRVLLPKRLPPGDGGLSLGQAAFGLALLENGKIGRG